MICLALLKDFILLFDQYDSFSGCENSNDRGEQYSCQDFFCWLIAYGLIDLRLALGIR